MYGEKTDTRIYHLDNLKCFLIILVVVGHFAEQAMNRCPSDALKYIFIVIYTFHMPMFLFVSGCLSVSSLNDARKVREKVFRLLNMYLALKVLDFAVKYYTLGEKEFHIFSEEGVPWYLFSLAVYYVLGYVFRDAEGRRLLTGSVFLALCCGYDAGIGDFLCLSRTIVFFPFFLLGERWGRQIIEWCQNRKREKMYGIVTLAVFAVAVGIFLEKYYFLRPLFTGRNSYEKLGAFYPVGFLFRLVAYGITMITAIAIMMLIPSNRNHFSAVGMRTLPIYFWHMPVLRLLVHAGMYEFLLLHFKACGQVLWILCAPALAVLIFLLTTIYDVIKDTIKRSQSCPTN